MSDRTTTNRAGDEGSGSHEGTERQKTPGIIYLSRIPPYMRPLKIRHLFSQHGSVGRVYLQLEDPLVHKRRKKLGGNKRKKYTEGWVEFHDKRVAKAVALALNNTPVCSKKRSYYHDDLWNIKYLSKFKWTHLTEKIAYENAVREQKLRTAVSQARRENNHYLQSVDKSKAAAAIVERKTMSGKLVKPVNQDVQKKFKQRRVKDDNTPTQPLPTANNLPHPILSDSLLRKVLL